MPFPYRPSKIRDFSGKYKLALVQYKYKYKHKHNYKYRLALVWCRVLHAPMRVVFSVLAEELGHRLSTFRGTESNLYCTYCRFYKVLPPFLA